jgi:para-aminobenzoate synthetase component 1
VVLGEPSASVYAHNAAGVDALLDQWRSPAVPIRSTTDDEPPFIGGWIGALSYEYGLSVEPTAGVSPPATRPWPLAAFHRLDGAWCYDKLLRHWHAVGATEGLPPRSSDVRESANVRVGPWSSAVGRAAYTRAVGRAIEYIRAGDIYQVNLAHELRAVFEGTTIGALLRLVIAADPWYAALIPVEDAPLRRAIVSASPELFFTFDAASRRLVTRPMKGTRSAALAEELRQSPKDQAELAMITDLMRNDLGRVAEFGSVRVEDPRVLEPHGGLVQGVSSVAAKLRAGLGLPDVVRALFPGGSITGAPKVRAMQIIAELESAPRGPYCGALGYVSDDGNAAFSMGIRTLTLEGLPGMGRHDFNIANASYRVGAGIVADSTPDGEWTETLVKAAPLRALGLAAPESIA